MSTDPHNHCKIIDVPALGQILLYRTLTDEQEEAFCIRASIPELGYFASTMTVHPDRDPDEVWASVCEDPSPAVQMVVTVLETWAMAGGDEDDEPDEDEA